MFSFPFFQIYRMYEGNGFILPLKVIWLFKNMLTFLLFAHKHCKIVYIISISALIPYEICWLRINHIKSTKNHATINIDLLWSGPKPKTIFDFWNMIWVEEVCNIVCLQNLEEGNTVWIKYIYKLIAINKKT